MNLFLRLAFWCFVGGIFAGVLGGFIQLLARWRP